jgi:acyl-CoA dehydrogenase
MTETGPPALKEVAAATEAILQDRPPSDAAQPWDVTTWNALQASGLTLVAASPAGGGGGGSLREAAEVVRAAGAHALRAPIGEMSLAASWLLESAGLDLPGGVLTIALSCDDVTAAPTAEGRWELSGVARRIPFGQVADAVVLLATSTDGPIVILLPLTPGSVSAGTNLAGDPLDDLELHAVIAEGALIGEPAAQAYQLRIALTRLLLCAGAATTVQAATVQHVSDRVQFGRPLAKFQAVQQLVAELAGEVAALQIGVDAALLAVESDAPHAALAVAAAKCDADRSIHRITAIAHQLHGAIGATHEHALRQYTLRLWSWREEGGSGSQWARRIAGRVLDPAAPTVWEQVVGD